MKKILFMLIAAIIALSASAQTKRALVIGISDYQYYGANSWGTIHGANDADLIVPVLQAQGFKATKLCNKAATAKRIRKGLNDLLVSCKQGDMVYLHFSCHGQPVEDINGDEKDGWDESIVPYDAQKVFKKGKYEGQNHIIDDELHTYYQKLRKKIGKSGFVCVVVDACYAGGSSRGIDGAEDGEKEFVRGTNVGFSRSGKKFYPKRDTRSSLQIPKVPDWADMTILEACRRDQTNHEIKQSDKYYGPLSYYISQVLKKNKKLTKSLDWVEDVKKQMENRCKDGFTGRPKQNMVYETTIK